MLSGLNSALGLRRHTLVALHGITPPMKLNSQFLGHTDECISPHIYPVIFRDCHQNKTVIFKKERVFQFTYTGHWHFCLKPSTKFNSNCFTYWNQCETRSSYHWATKHLSKNPWLICHQQACICIHNFCIHQRGERWYCQSSEYFSQSLRSFYHLTIKISMSELQ